VTHALKQQGRRLPTSTRPVSSALASRRTRMSIDWSRSARAVPGRLSNSQM
jgi:hypothetical protein